MALKWLNAAVVDRTDWADGLFTLRIRAEGVKPFQAGQFLQLALPADEDSQEVVNRPYSVASPWGHELDFFIVRVEDGQLTPNLHLLTPGMQVLVNDRAAGRFTLEKTPDAETLWLCATGTGLAPYIAMLREPETWQRFSRIVLVHGARHLRDLAYMDELQQYQLKFSGKFFYVPTLTREDSAGVLRGRIPDLVDSGELENTTKCHLDSDSCVVMLCGNPAMLDQMESTLEKRGMVRHRSKSPGHIVLERYW